MRMICSLMACSSATDSIDVSEKTRTNPSPDLMYIECNAMNCDNRANAYFSSVSITEQSWSVPRGGARWTDLLSSSGVHDGARDGDAVDGDDLAVAVLDRGVVLLHKHRVHEPNRQGGLADAPAAPRRSRARRGERCAARQPGAYTHSEWGRRGRPT